MDQEAAFQVLVEHQYLDGDSRNHCEPSVCEVLVQVVPCRFTEYLLPIYGM